MAPGGHSNSTWLVPDDVPAEMTGGAGAGQKTTMYFTTWTADAELPIFNCILASSLLLLLVHL